MMALAKSASGLWLALILLVASMVTVVQGTDFECLTALYESEVELEAGEEIGKTGVVDSMLDCALRCFKHAVEHNDEPLGDGCRVAEYNEDSNKCRLFSGAGWKWDEDRSRVFDEIALVDTGNFDDKVVQCTTGSVEGLDCGSVDNCVDLGVPETTEVGGTPAQG